MATEKTRGIVVRVVDFSETSKIATIFTRELGKVTGMAKGAYRRNGPFEGALDLLSIVQLNLIHKSTSSLDLLTEAKLERRFRSASASLDRLHCAYYLAELLAVLTEEADVNVPLYELAEQTLVAIDSGDSEGASPHWLLARFECQMLEMVGHAPMLANCVECGREVPAELRQFFGSLAGGLYCSTCRVGKKSVITVSSEAWNLLDTLKASPPDGTSVAETPKPFGGSSRRGSGLGEVREVLNHFVAHLLGSRPRLQAYLRVPIDSPKPAET